MSAPLTNEQRLVSELRDALNSPRGGLDCWLGSTSEDDARVAINALAKSASSERRLFAAMAMQGLILRGSSFTVHDAAIAVKYSDALLAALKEVQP
jgi:hypothetical protein